MAVCTTSPAFPVKVVGGAGGGSSGVPPYPPFPLPSSPFPKPIEIPAASLTPRPAVFQPVANLRAEREPREGTPLDPAADAPLRGELLGGGIGGEPEGEAGERIGTERRPAAPRLHFVAHTVERAAPAE